MCEFSDGKGGKEAKRWAPEWGGRFHEKGCGLMRAFVAGKGSVAVLGGKVNGEYSECRWNHLTFTLPLSLLTKGLLSSFHP